MDTTTLGPNGPPVPPLAVGTMYFGTQVAAAAAHEILDAALDAGATFLDTANNYAFWVEDGTGDESESTLGEWFGSRPGARERVTVATKIGARPRPGSRSLDDAIGLAAPAVREQVEASPRRLRTDHVDVLYAHIDDTEVPIEETVGALQDEVRRGTTGVIGLLAWMARRATPVIPVVGVSSSAQLHSAAQAVGTLLPDDVLAELETARTASP